MRSLRCIAIALVAAIVSVSAAHAEGPAPIGEKRAGHGNVGFKTKLEAKAHAGLGRR